jgi:hypothetical protein
MDCAALIAGYLAGIQIDQLDRTRVYEIPAAQVAMLSTPQMAVARACALKHGIKYRIVKDPKPALIEAATQVPTQN